MYKKIFFIKNLLKVFILGFVLFNILKSCSMAYNIDDIYEYAMQLQTMSNVPSDISYCANKIIQKYEQLKILMY